MEYRANFAERVKERRKEMNMTQEDLAGLVKVSYQTISAYESKGGKGKTPTLGNAVKIAEILGISLDYLCGLDTGIQQVTKKSYADIVRQLDNVNSMIPIDSQTSDIALRLTFNDNHLAKFYTDRNKMQQLFMDKVINIDIYEKWSTAVILDLEKIPAPCAVNMTEGMRLMREYEEEV